MEFTLLKEANVELCENMYALSMNYLRNKNNIELKYLMSCLDELEIYIRQCDELNILKKYIDKLNFLCNKIEGIINE